MSKYQHMACVSHEPQPHPYGALPLQYRQGTHVANTETLPTWSPEQALHPQYPYTLSEYMLDTRRWMAATKVSEPRLGPLLALAVGGAARSVVDDIPERLLINGGNEDLGDGNGMTHHSGPSILFIHLQRAFPDNLEANMLRAGLNFFSFTPRHDETQQIVFLRFDTMLEKANRLAELGVSWPFRSWMLLSLMRLPPKKWSESLKEMGHRFPNTQQEYKTLQQAMIR